MDFFEAQVRAQRRTSRLLALFGIAVAGTVLAAYAAAVWLLSWAEEGAGRARAPELWQPRLLGLIGAGTLLVVGGASLYKWHRYAAGGRAVAEGLGARRVDPGSSVLAERRLLNVVEEMALASGTPVPGVYVLEEEAGINAFAAGLTPRDAVVAVTRGTLERLDRDELQGVIGHEFSHILNGDMRLNLRIAATVFGILVLGLAGRGILASLRHTRVRSKEKGAGGFILAVGAVGLTLMIIGYVGYFFGRLIQAAVSRQREFLADASAVQFTRNPAGIAGALKKIGGHAAGSRLESAGCAEIGHLFFAQSFRFSLAGLWATHPPLEERIRAIEPDFDLPSRAPSESAEDLNQPLGGVNKLRSMETPGRQTAAFAPGTPDAAMAGIGVLTPVGLTSARELLAETPAELRAAAHHPQCALAVIFGLLLSGEPGEQDRQLDVLRSWPDSELAGRLEQLRPQLAQLTSEHRLPVLQLALPALRRLPAAEVPHFIRTLQSLVEADGRRSTFEFALQKLVKRALETGRGSRLIGVSSLHAVRHELSVLLSVLARCADRDPLAVEQAFTRGAATLQPVTPNLRLTPGAEVDLEALDLALNRLASASPGIKQRALRAAAQCAAEDGRLVGPEAELLRAIAATLDCPMAPFQMDAG
jgi:Zn-dependent protease with chaperone function